MSSFLRVMNIRHAIIFLLCIGLHVNFICAQQIKSVNPEFKEYAALLNIAGYEMFSFDISSLGNHKYSLVFSVKSYKNGETVTPTYNGHELPKRGVYNLIRVSDNIPFMNDSTEIEELKKDASDLENDIFIKSDRINIGFFPGANETVKSCFIDLDENGSFQYKLNLFPLEKQKPDEPDFYMYDIRPFSLPDSIAISEFIPLVGVISFWFDPKYRIHRCCGENFLNPVLEKSDILKYSPHFYVIGVTLEDKETENK